MTSTTEMSARCEAVAKEIFELVNYFGGDEKLAKEITKKLVNEHRTLQANYIRMTSKILTEYSKIEWTDARNEDAVAWAKAAVKGTESNGIRHI